MTAVRKETSSLGQYLGEIGRFATLSSEQEAELARRVTAGDEAARQALITANLRFVVRVAKKYQHCGLTLADLISEGNSGLMEAARRFDGTRGFKFITYAVWWIQQAILSALTEQSRAASTAAIRLDASPFADDDAETLSSVVADESLVSPLDRIGEAQAAESLAARLRRLDARERVVVTAYFGLGNEEAKTLKEIAAKLGVSEERASQNKEAALRKLYGKRRMAAKKKPAKRRKKKFARPADVDWEYLCGMPEFRALYQSRDEFAQDYARCGAHYSIPRMLQDRKQMLAGTRYISGHTIRRVRMFFRAERKRQKRLAEQSVERG